MAYVSLNVLLMGIPTIDRTFLFAGNLSIVLFVFLSEFIQDAVTNLLAFLFAHVFGAAFSLFLMGFIEKSFSYDYFAGVPVLSLNLFVTTIFMLVITVLAIRTRLDGKMRYNPEIAEGAFFILLFLFTKMAKVQGGELLVLVSEMIWGILCILYYNARNLAGSLFPFKDRDYVPYESIRKINGQMLGFSVLAAFICMLLSTLFDYGKEILGALKTVLLAVLRFIFSFIHFEEEAEYVVTEKEKVEPSSGMLLPQQYEDNSIWHTIWQVLYWIVAALVMIFIVYLLIKLLKSFYSFFNRTESGLKKRLSRDEVEYLNPFVKRESTLSSEKKARDFFGLKKRLSPKGRVLLLFQKYIKKGPGYHEISRAMTPSELEHVAWKNDDASATWKNDDDSAVWQKEKDFTAWQLYEKARYSSASITDEDVNAMKKACR
jgi:hypothetical protein